MRVRSQNVTGEKARSQKGRKPAPDRQKKREKGREKMGLTALCHKLWGPVPSPWPEAMGWEKNGVIFRYHDPASQRPPEKQGEGRKRREAVGGGPGGLEVAGRRLPVVLG